MKLTSIKRIFLFEKAVRKQKIKGHYTILLYSIFLIEPCTSTTVIRQLKKVDRVWAPNVLQERIKYLLSVNLVQRINKRYSLTPSGLGLLKHIETRLRKERHDK
jgi:hypothetical protein